MPGLYELLLFVHVLGAIAWVGGALYVLLAIELARRAGEREHVIKVLHYDDRLAPLLYIPAALVVLGAGIWLVLEGPWSFSDGWVTAGLTMFTVALVGGAAFFIPAGKRLNAAVAAHGPASSEAAAVVDRLRVVAWLDFLLLVAVVFVMTAKPF